MAYKLTHLDRVFPAGGRFDSARHVNPVRPHRFDSLPDILRGKTARENHRAAFRRLPCDVPVEGMSRAAVGLRRIGIEKNSSNPVTADRIEAGEVLHAKDLYHPPPDSVA